MKVLVLGAAAGGGFPQWNCNCRNCGGLRTGSLRAKARTQSSIAVSTSYNDWTLVNASPDILTQLKARPQLQPGRNLRDTGIKAIVLVDSQIDHTAGLAMLREGARLQVYCTASVHEDLTTGNPLLKMLESYCGVDWHEIRPASSSAFRIPGIDGVEFSAVPVIGKAPPYSPHREAPKSDDNIALMMTDVASGGRVFYAPGLAAIEPSVWEYMSGAD